MQNITRRLIVWAIVVALILLIPLVLTLLGSGVDREGWHWPFFVFVFMGPLLYGSALTYELVARKMSNGAYRAAVGVAVVTVVLLVWINGAVGIVGDGPVNLMYFGVLAIGLVSAFIARFKPHGMARALFAMALAQFLVPVIALIFWPPPVISWAPGVVQVFGLNAIFAMLWIGSALLFRRASATDSK